MTDASQTLAEFAVGLTYDRIPAEVVERAKECVIDTVGAWRFNLSFLLSLACLAVKALP